MAVRVLLYIFVTLFSIKSYAQLVINEVSQGGTGSQEFVELLVTGTGTCKQCVDIRGWILDDNNGWHATPMGAGQGIAAGCVRLANIPFWSCVPVGTLIVIYNNIETNISLPAGDVNSTDNNCKFVIPMNYTSLFESNATLPNSGATGNYSALVYTTGANWTYVGMANGDDSFQITNPAATGSAAFSIGWGNNSVAQTVYFAGSATGTTTYNANSTDNNPSNPANWVRVSAASGQTPGAANNAANAAWINSLSNNCTIPAVLNATSSSTNILCNGLCTGTASITVTGGTAPYSYTWSGTASANTTANATGLCAGAYQVIVRDADGCKDTILSSNIVITEPLVLNLTTVGSWSPCTCLCSGVESAFPTGGTPNYTTSWSNGSTSQFQNGVCAGSLTATVTDANGCVKTSTVVISP